jgi:glucose/arabinose dehydrogenase
MRSTGTSGGLTTLRTDITARRLMSTPGNGTRLARDAKTGEFLLLLENGNVRRIDLQPDGAASSAQLYSPTQIGMPTGSSAHGMSLGPDGTLYVVSHLSQSASGNTSKASVWKGIRGAAGDRTWSKLAETASYPRSRTYYDHEWSGIVADPEGRYVYVNAGSRTDHGEVQTNGGAFPGAREVALTSGVFRLPASARDLQLPNDDAALRAMGVVFARGVRNSFDLEFAPNGDLLAGDNGPDADYHEELNWIREGHHYGFPWRLGNEDNQMQFPAYDAAADRRLQRGAGFSAIDGGSWRNDPAFPARPDGVPLTEPILNAGPDADQYRNAQTGAVEKASAANRPYATFTDHSSPLGLTFDRNEGALCADLAGGLFVLRFGKAAGQAFEAGRDLLHLQVKKTGDQYGPATTTQLVRGFSGPVDAVLVADRMYVLDRNLEGSGQGALWEITLPGGR